MAENKRASKDQSQPKAAEKQGRVRKRTTKKQAAVAAALA